jgi:thiamine kinase-like enzyme
LRASLADTNVGNFIVCPGGRLWVIDLDKACFHRLAFTAARQQQRAWEQLLRSAAKC